MLSLDRGGDLILYEVERPSSLSHSCAGQMALQQRSCSGLKILNRSSRS